MTNKTAAGKVLSRLVRFWSTNEDVDQKTLKKMETLINCYDIEDLITLSGQQLGLIYQMINRSENTDILSYSLAVSRRSLINTANSLVRRGFCYWDIPTYSNRDDGMDLTFDRSKLKCESILRL